MFNEEMEIGQEIKILGCKLVLTCTACPEQYDVFLEGEEIGYLRLRHGIFSAHYPNSDGEEIYCVTTKGDGCFYDNSERRRELEFAVSALLTTYAIDFGLDIQKILPKQESSTNSESQNDNCICKGNWQNIIKDCGKYMGMYYTNEKGKKWRFEGVLHSSDDYYYVMTRKGKTQLLSCVGDIEGYGFDLLPYQNINVYGMDSNLL
jgi:hypothetical protein